MKRKIGTLIEEDVVRMAKRRAAEEGRPLAEIIQDALVGYLGRTGVDLETRRGALARLLDDPLRLDEVELERVLDVDFLAGQIQPDLIAEGSADEGEDV